MGRQKKEKPVIVVEKTEDIVKYISPSEIIPFKEPESYLVRWKGGEEVFTSKSQADFAVNTRVDAYIVPDAKSIVKDKFGHIV